MVRYRMDGLCSTGINCLHCTNHSIPAAAYKNTHKKIHINKPRILGMNWIFGFVAIALLVIGLVGQAFEMRRIRIVAQDSGDVQGSANVFADRRNFKWYAVIGAGIILWYMVERNVW